MKRNIVRAVFFLATLLLSLAPVASAQHDGVCSNARVAGEWGYTETGWVMGTTGWEPVASVGRYTLDPDGNLSGTRYGTEGGTTTIKGTATVNPDCTGTYTASIYSGTTLLLTVVKALVYVDNARGFRAIVTSVTLPNNTSAQTVRTVDGKKLFPSRGNEPWSDAEAPRRPSTSSS